MANNAEDRLNDVAPKGGHASANPEPAPLAGHAQREGEGDRDAASLQGSGADGGARSDADRNVADVESTVVAGDVGTREQSGGPASERTGG